MLRRIVLPLMLLGPLLLSAPAQALAGQFLSGPQRTPAPPPPPPAADVSFLEASPYEGHVGDTIRVSGANLRPYTQYNLFLTCPAYTDPSVYHLGNVVYVTHGPTTDGHGNFVGYQMTAITLHGLTDSPCYIYAEVAGQGGGNPNIPASYHIYPRGWKVARCATHICGQVSISPSVPRSGHVETLHIWTRFFAGAHTAITIRYGNGTPKTIYKDLGPAGERYIRVRVPAGLPRKTSEQVSVQFWLGKFTGNANSDHAIAR